MSNTLRIQFLDIPSPTNSISFEYGGTSSATQSVSIDYVNDGERYNTGDFEIGTSSVDENYSYFTQYFITDFDPPTYPEGSGEVSDAVYKFDYGLDKLNNAVELTFKDGDIGNVNINNYNNTFTYSLIEEVEKDYSNQLSISLNSVPLNSDTISFTYYPDYPLTTPTEDIELTFISATPSGTVSGEILIGSTISTTYDNMELYFNTYFNNNGGWNTEKIIDGLTSSFIITPKNKSIIYGLTFSGDITTKTVQTDTDIYSPTTLVKSSQLIYSPASGTTIDKLIRVSIDLSSNPVFNDILWFNIYLNGINLITYFKIFKNSVIPSEENQSIEIGEIISETIKNTYDNLVEYNQPNEIYFQYSYTPTSVIIEFLVGQSDEVDIDIPAGVPSGLFINGPLVTEVSSTFDSCVFDIYAWEGNVSNVPTAPIWSVTKQIISEDQTRLYLDFNTLIKDGYLSGISTYLSNATSLSLPSKTAKWVKIVATNKSNGVDKEFKEYDFYALSGWTDSNNHTVPRLLMSGGSTEIIGGIKTYVVRRYYHKDSVKRVHYKVANNVGAVSSVGNENNIYSYLVDGDTTESRQNFKSFKIPSVDNTSNYLGDKVYHYFYYDDNRDLDERQRVTLITEYYNECKYELVTVIFKNRYGVLETLSMGKVSRKNLETTRESYTRSIVDINGTINSSKHSKLNYNINGTDQWVLNSGFIPDYMNDPIEDLFMSDEIWLITDYYEYVPVILKDSNFNRKKHITDGLINYTLKFESSHEKRKRWY